jgi:hypothetical protein
VHHASRRTLKGHWREKNVSNKHMGGCLRHSIWTLQYLNISDRPYYATIFEKLTFTIARIHSQFESLGFVGKYDQSPTNIVNLWTWKYGGADFLQNPRIFSLQNGPRMRAYIGTDNGTVQIIHELKRCWHYSCLNKKKLLPSNQPTFYRIRNNKEIAKIAETLLAGFFKK